MTENKKRSFKYSHKSISILKAFENYRKQFLIYRVMKFLKLR